MNQTQSKALANPFTNPDHYRRLMLKHDLVTYNTQEYAGKSFMCVFFTRFCGVGCPFCFFKSAPARNEITVADQFNEEGIDRFIEFCNQANLGYILISGGGEPLTQKRAVLRTIAEVETNRIVLVTSGNWAMNKEAARRYLAEIDAAMKARKNPCKVTVRVSVSAGHAIKLGTTPAFNLIQLFESEYPNHPYLKFQIHGFENDPMFQKVLDLFPGHQLEYNRGQRASDDEAVIKVIPQKIYVKLPSGYGFVTGISKIFGSDLRPNLHEIERLHGTIKTFERDLEESEDNNSAVLFNTNGDKGLDWSLNYNGNICLWQNQVNDNQWNIYEDSFPKVLNETFRDPITLSYIENGCKYRERIVAEVSPRAVLRLKSISLRDFSGTVVFEEEKTRLYYAIRALQDYFKAGRIVNDEFDKLPEELKDLIMGSAEMAKELYHAAEYTIVDQYKRKQFDSVAWRDLLELIRLGHYDLTPEQVQEALDYYNARTELKTYQTIDEVEHEKGEAVQIRLTRRLMYMKPSAFELQKPQLVATP
ncbi:MAG: radical SAM protein [Verrucomicrobia bacterium]|nr:radical SAM protein [Verrucomicrobiota bacterium]